MRRSVIPICLATTLGLTSGLNAQNLVTNGSMEEAGARAGLAKGWEVGWSSGGDHEAHLDSEVKKAGQFGQRVINPEGGAKFPRLQQTVKVRKHHRYRVSAWARAKGSAGLWLSKGGWGRHFGARAIPNDQRWHELAWELNSGDSERVDIIFMMMTPNREACTVWVDEVSLTEIGPSPKATSSAVNAAAGRSYELLTPPNYGRAKDPALDRVALTDGKWRSGHWTRKHTVVWNLKPGQRALVLLDLGRIEPIAGLRLACVLARAAHPPKVQLFVGRDPDTLFHAADFDAGDVDRVDASYQTEWCERTGLRVAGRYVLAAMTQPRRGLVCVTEIEVLKGDFPLPTARPTGQKIDLETFATEGNLSRFMPPVDLSVRTPHVPWAKRSAGPRPRVLFLVPPKTVRDPIELVQRMSLDAAVRYMSTDLMGYFEHRHLMRELAAPWDALVLSSVNWTNFRSRAREAVLAKVRAGMGLFIIKPLGADELMAEIAKDLKGTPAPSFFTKGDVSGFPYLDWVRTGCGLRTGVLGRGRVAVIDYDLGTNDGWPERTCSFFPPHPGYIVRPDTLPWWEPYFAHLARTLLWTAGRDVPVRLAKVEVASVGRDEARLQVDTTGNRDDVVLSAICVGPGNREVARSRIALALEGKPTPIALRAPLVTGHHFVWLWVEDGEGHQLDWASAMVRIPGPRVERIDVANTRVEKGEMVQGRVHLSPAGSLDDCVLEVSLVDYFGRQVAVGRRPARAQVELALPTENVLSLTARVVARLYRGSRVEATDFKVIAVAREPAHDDYLVGIWASYYPIACGRPWADAILSKQRELGVDVAFMAHSPAEIYHQAYAEHNMWPMAESMSRIFFKGAPQYASLNIASPEFLPEYRSRVREHATTAYRWGAFDFSVGDECGYTLRYDEHTIAQFREYLRERYPTLGELNEQWGTQFGSWDEIQPARAADVERSISIGPALEFALFGDWLFLDALRAGSSEVKRIDPRNRFGLSGTREPGHYIGFDWWGLMQTIDHLAFYDGLQRECIRSFKKPGDVITSFVGHDYFDLDERQARYFLWLELFSGFQGVSIYSATSGTWHGYVRHDLSWPERAKWTMEELAQLKTGIGRSILTAERAAPGIAVHYSQRSLRATAFHHGSWLHNATGLCEALKDMGLQFDFVADEQIEKGALLRRGDRVLILPLSLSLSQKEIEAVTAFVQSGGRLIVVGDAGLLNEHGKVRSPGALDGLLGIQAKPAGSQPDEANMELFGTSLTARPCNPNVRCTAASPMGAFAGSKIPAVTRRSVGSGEVWLVNFLWDGYRSFQAKGVGGEIVERTSADEKVASAHRHILARLLQGTGLEPPVTVRANGQPRAYVEQVVYRRGPITYLGLMPRYLAGRGIATVERHWIEDDDYEPVDVDLGKAWFVYDMRQSKHPGRTAHFRTSMTPGVAHLYALCPYQVDGLTIRVPDSVMPGQQLRIAVSLTAKDAEPGDHVVHVVLREPGGRRSECHRTNLLTSKGQGAWYTPLALNARQGRWTVVARDVTSGIKTETSFVVRSEVPR